MSSKHIQIDSQSKDYFVELFGWKYLNHSRLFLCAFKLNSNGVPLELTMVKEIDFQPNSGSKKEIPQVRWYAWTPFCCAQSVARSFGYDNYSQTPKTILLCVTCIQWTICIYMKIHIVCISIETGKNLFGSRIQHSQTHTHTHNV